MLTPQDDLLGHQLPTTFDHVGNSDPTWMERYWYNGFSVPDGKLMLEAGLGLHANRNVMDGYVSVTVDGIQRNLRVSRHARPLPLSPAIGPFRIEVVEGMREHRLVVEPNASGIEMDARFVATMSPYEEEHHFRRRLGKVTEDMERYHQGGRFEGWVIVDGKRYELKPETFWGQRDHSWGIRAELRTDETCPPLTVYPPMLYVWGATQFEKYGVHLYLNEMSPERQLYTSGQLVHALGSGGKSSTVTGIAHRIEWKPDPLGQSVDSATLDVELKSGQRLRLRMRALPARVFLKGGLYGGLNGWFPGDDKGKLYLEHDRWDLTDPTTRRRLRTLASQAYEVDDGASKGCGILQLGVVAGYPLYKEVQQHPAP